MVRTRESAVSLGIAIALMLLLTAFVVQALVPGPVAAASDRLPNLRMLPLSDWRIQDVNGRRLLRFTTIMGNVGPGHFEVRGRRPDQATMRMRIRQVIFDSAGGWRTVKTGAVGKYSGDGHDHWHVQRIMTYEMYRVDKPTVLRAYLRRWKFEVGVFFDGVGPEATDEEFLRVAPGHPVFEVRAL